MANKRYNENDDIFDFENDYLEINNDNDDDDYDIFSFSSEDIYSDSSNDVYIGNRRKPEREDVYVGRRRNTSDVSFERRRRPVTPEIPDDYPRQVRAGKKNPTERFEPVRKKRDDDISDFEARHGKRKRKKRGKGFIFLVVLLALIIGAGSFVSTVATSIVGSFKKADPIQHIAEASSLASSPDVRNILLIGTDSAKGGSARSDSMMIASVNKNTGKITIVSILRDTHVDIPGKREAKINAAYSWGGANLLIQTIEKNFGIKIDDYASVDFKMFTALVDALGGITVEVTEKEANYLNNRQNYGRAKKPPKYESGESVHLTGYQALWYVRLRKLDSDFMRAERQRKVISCIMNDVKTRLNPAGVFGLIDTAKSVAPYIKTTLSTADFWSLFFNLASCFMASEGQVDKMLVSEQIPFEGTWSYSREWDGASISINKNENKEKLYKLLYEDNGGTATEK